MWRVTSWPRLRRWVCPSASNREPEQRGQSRAESLPRSIEAFDWQTFQQEYRDYMDVAKLAQLVPVIGAPVGIVVNGRLMRRLGSTAIHAYRMRWFSTHRVRPEAPPSHTSVK